MMLLMVTAPPDHMGLIPGVHGVMREGLFSQYPPSWELFRWYGHKLNGMFDPADDIKAKKHKWNEEKKKRKEHHWLEKIDDKQHAKEIKRECKKYEAQRACQKIHAAQRLLNLPATLSDNDSPGPVSSLSLMSSGFSDHDEASEGFHENNQPTVPMATTTRIVTQTARTMANVSAPCSQQPVTLMLGRGSMPSY